MTSAHPTSRPATTARTARARAAVLVMGALLAFGLQGCSFFSIFSGLPFIGHRKPRNPAPASAPQATARPKTADTKSASNAKSKSKATPSDAPVVDERSPDQPYEWYKVAQKRVRADSLESAEAALRSALAMDRAYAPALAMLSRLYYDTGRHAQGIQLVESARSHAGEFAGGFPPALTAGLALHYEALGRHDDARHALQSIGGGRSADVGTAWSYVLLRGATPDSATAPAAADVREHPKSAEAQNNYGITRLRAGDLDAARAAFHKAIDLDAKLPGPYYNLTILEKFYALDDAAAARWFRAYRERSSEDPDSLFAVLGREPARNLAGKDD